MSEPGAKDEVFARASLRVGQVVKGKYRLDRVIGVGGMAVVYAATHRNQKRVAVKMLHVELSYVGDVRARFLREGYVANTVNHPGALAVLDEDVADDGAAFLVMELLEGQPLDTLADAKGNRLSEAIALSVGDQLLDVLSAAHAKTIIHRDIKPANLFITRDGTLKVLDFGIARLRDAALHDATSTGVVLGTPAFMSPEQAYGRNDQIDAQSDVFAAGATLFKILAGRSVHGGGTSSEILIRAATSPAPPLASLRPDIDPRVASLVDRALAFDKTARWATAAAMRDAIRELAQGSAGKQGLADLVDEMGVTSTRPVSAHADTAAIPSAASAFAAPDAQPRPPLPAAPIEPDPTRASPLQQAGTTGATGATAAPITRNAQGAPTVARPAAPVVRSALFGISMAFGLAALVLVPLVATGRYHLRAPAQPVASETVFAAPTTPTAPTTARVPPSAAPSALSAPAATPTATASASAEEARSQVPLAPASAVTPQAPKPKVTVPAPGDTPRPPAPPSTERSPMTMTSSTPRRPLANSGLLALSSREALPPAPKKRGFLGSPPTAWGPSPEEIRISQRSAWSLSGKALRRRGGVRLALCMLPMLALLATSTHAYAGDPAAARAQLEAGYQLKEQGNYADALPHLVESLRLDPQLKTLTNLADCEEHLGRLVDAQIHWVMARDRAGAEGNDRFKASAEARLTALESRLPKLVIKLAPDSPPNTEVTRDGTVLGTVSLGTPLPTDTGDHTVIARAPGFAPQTFTVTLAERDQKELVVHPGAAVPVATAAPVPVGSVATPSGPVPTWSAQKTGALVAAGVGVIGVGLGVAFGLETGSHWSSAQHECGAGCGPSSPAQSERSTAMTDATISDVSFVVAGVAVASAVTLWFTAPKAKEAPRPLDAIHFVPVLGRHDAGLGVLASF